MRLRREGLQQEVARRRAAEDPQLQDELRGGEGGVHREGLLPGRPAQLQGEERGICRIFIKKYFVRVTDNFEFSSFCSPVASVQVSGVSGVVQDHTKNLLQAILAPLPTNAYLSLRLEYYEEVRGSGH